MNIDQSVLDQVSNELQAYVYLLVDPNNGVPFYVGKGRGIRHAAHLAEALIPVNDDAGERSRKLAKIDEILRAGEEPEVWILRYNLSSNEYTAVEAAAIDLLMSFSIFPLDAKKTSTPLAFVNQLTNGRREQAKGHGVTLLKSLIEEFAAPTLTTTKPVLLITLNGWIDLPSGQRIAGDRVRYGAGFRPEWLASGVRGQSYEEIGRSVSAWWSLSPKTVKSKKIEHIAAVHRGVTRALFKIIPDTWDFDTNGFDKNGRVIRKTAVQLETVVAGDLFDQVVGAYGHRVPPRDQGAQNSLDYWPRIRKSKSN